MLIGLIADTHIPEAGPDLFPEVYDRFREERVEMILHAGDIHILPVLDRLEQRVGVPVIACRGNGDDGGAGRPVCPDDPRLRPTWTLNLEDLRVGLVHDIELDRAERPISAQMGYHFGGPCDVVVFGDTHVATVQVADDALLVNPGSPMYPWNYDTAPGTVGFLHVDGRTAEAWIEPLRPEGRALPLGEGGITDHREAALRHPDQWVLFAVHTHDRVSGTSIGSVVAAGFDPAEVRSLERSVRRRHPSAIVLAFHTGAPPERGVARWIGR